MTTILCGDKKNEWRVRRLRVPWFGWLVAAGLVLVGVAASGNLRAGETARSEWVSTSADGKLVYKATAAGDRIMDFSSAGYAGGGVALPAVPVRRTVSPSGTADDTAVIQAALNEVSALPLDHGFRGAVLLAPGTFPCSNTLTITASGVVLRGSGSGAGAGRSTLQMAGGRHVAIAIHGPAGGRRRPARPETNGVQTVMAGEYVPSGTSTFTVRDAAGFAAGDLIAIQRPVTAAWVKFLGMDTLVRDGAPQTWIRPGTSITIERRIAAVSGNQITLEVPLSDSFDAKYLNPPGARVLKETPPALLTQAGIEDLHIISPLQRVNHTEELYLAVQLTGEDCWMRDVAIEETMNSVAIGGRRITLERVSVSRQALHQGASKPAEFAPNGDQILLDHCSVNADNVWFAATGGGHSGPIVLLNCTFGGNGAIEGHMRWTTGILLDNCRLPGGEIDFKNRGAMGSGHGWGSAWSVAWNCVARGYVVQQPPGACNWAIGCIGPSVPTARPFDKEPTLPAGIFDSPGQPVAPSSLYLAQLAERLGPQALRNIGYASTAGF
jgi:hypothetical protein